MLGSAGTGKTKVMFEMLKTERFGRAVIVCANNVRAALREQLALGAA